MSTSRSGGRGHDCTQNRSLATAFVPLKLGEAWLVLRWSPSLLERRVLDLVKGNLEHSQTTDVAGDKGESQVA